MSRREALAPSGKTSASSVAAARRAYGNAPCDHARIPWRRFCRIALSVRRFLPQRGDPCGHDPKCNLTEGDIRYETNHKPGIILCHRPCHCRFAVCRYADHQRRRLYGQLGQARHPCHPPVRQCKKLLHRQLQLRHAVFPLRQHLQQCSRHLRQPPRHRAAQSVCE